MFKCAFHFFADKGQVLEYVVCRAADVVVCRFREPVLESIRDGHAPAMSAIQADHSLAYSFGWTIVRFIEQKMVRSN